MLALTAGLFSLLGLKFVQDWLLAPLSVFAISATLGGLGIAIVRANEVGGGEVARCAGARPCADATDLVEYLFVIYF